MWMVTREEKGVMDADVALQYNQDSGVMLLLL